VSPLRGRALATGAAAPLAGPSGLDARTDTRRITPVAAVDTPVFRDLTVGECRTFLASRNVGRIAFTLRDRVDVQPVNYASEGDWIFGRTSEGTKLATLRDQPWCAFETDDVRGLFDWSSVVAKGTFSVLDPKVGSLHTYQRADALLRALFPQTQSSHDPAPHRRVLFGIFVHEISGRESRL
jgi:nitroimidazol reductase NimA-like FMN-containing flavoprotein (pyridoxamine 5'-phosphate oxidase superfamily)